MPRHQIAADLVISACVEMETMLYIMLHKLVEQQQISFSNLMKMELAPLYSISAILSMAAQEWRTGIAFLASTEPEFFIIPFLFFHLGSVRIGARMFLSSHNHGSSSPP